MRLLISPTPNENSGMYIYNLAQSLSKHFDIVNYGNKRAPASKELFRYLFKSDIFLLNWIETEPLKTNGTIRYCLVQVFLTLAKILNKTVIWTFHNLEPHNKKENILSKKIIAKLSKYSDLIIHHTTESLYLTNEKKNYYFFHPFKIPNQTDRPNETPNYKYDILIWGKISPYKGVAEFLDFVKTDQYLRTLKILVAGETHDKNYEKRIVDALSTNIIHENFFHSDQQLKELHDLSRFTFFSHQGASVLNSGQLVVSLGFGANIIGPNKGAFKELKDKGLISTYKNFEQINNIIKSDISVDNKKRQRFMVDHSWESFAKGLTKRIYLLDKTDETSAYIID